MSLALLLSIGMVGIAISRYNEARVTIDRMEGGFKRAQTQDRLIGTHVDVAMLIDGTTDDYAAELGKRTLLWIIDVENCAGCFDELGGWRRLEQLTDHALILLLIGKPSAEVRRGLRLFKRTVVERTTRERVLAEVGPLLPNTKFLLGADGIAILVDSRASGQKCGWSFDAQVGAVEGVNGPGAIRIVASGTS